MSGSLMVMTSVVSVLAPQVASLRMGSGEWGVGDGEYLRRTEKLFLEIYTSHFLSPVPPPHSPLPNLDDLASYTALYAVEQQPEGRLFHERSYFFPVSSSRAAQERS